MTATKTDRIWSPVIVNGPLVTPRPTRLDDPFRWPHPSRASVDVAAGVVPVAFVADVFAVIAWAKQHTFRVVTSSGVERLRSYVGSEMFWRQVGHEARRLGYRYDLGDPHLADGQNVYDVDAWFARRSLPNLQLPDFAADGMPACSGCSSSLCPDCAGRAVRS